MKKVSEIPGASLVNYNLNQNLTGEQYFYAFQLGGTYRLMENLSVFGGLRSVLANASYVGAITNIKGNVKLPEAMGGITMEQSSEDYKLDCSQSGFGITPIIGVDWNLGKLNLAAKYEFRTRIELENDSKNTSENVTDLMPAYADGAKNRSDIPALLTLGAQYEIADNFRAMIGGVYYWDKDAKGTPIKKGDNTWEANFGVEWDMNDKVMLSFGGQRTQFGFDDADMSDTNFFTGCSSLAIGGAYKFSEKMKLNVGYMHSFYDNHKFTNVNGTACDYTRKNDAVGVSLDIRF